mmetsp:Transcript_16884/g.40019  ORF Transcript_16884/g.40019 Transcript_16884/m.40019 type:complete len:283 (-) Transcript_16884:253-1101(-)
MHRGITFLHMVLQQDTIWIDTIPTGTNRQEPFCLPPTVQDELRNTLQPHVLEEVGQLHVRPRPDHEVRQGGAVAPEAVETGPTAALAPTTPLALAAGAFGLLVVVAILFLVVLVMGWVGRHQPPFPNQARQLLLGLGQPDLALVGAVQLVAKVENGDPSQAPAAAGPNSLRSATGAGFVHVHSAFDNLLHDAAEVRHLVGGADVGRMVRGGRGRRRHEGGFGGRIGDLVDDGVVPDRVFVLGSGGLLLGRLSCTGGRLFFLLVLVGLGLLLFVLRTGAAPVQ